MLRNAVRELIHDWRHPAPLVVRYLRCDTCGEVTAHSSDRGVIGLTSAELTAPPPETVCDECGHAQPRTLGDEICADTTVSCAGRRFRRLGSKRSRRRCAREFVVPVAAPQVVCPWCATSHSNPAAAR